MVNSTSDTKLINATILFIRICNLNPNTEYCVSAKGLTELGSNTTIPGTNFSVETCAKTGRKRVKKDVAEWFHNCCQTSCDSALYDDLNPYYVYFICFSRTRHDTFQRDFENGDVQQQFAGSNLHLFPGSREKALRTAPHRNKQRFIISSNLRGWLQDAFFQVGRARQHCS